MRTNGTLDVTLHQAVAPCYPEANSTSLLEELRMFAKTRKCGLLALPFLLLAPAAFAQITAIEGDVKAAFFPQKSDLLLRTG